MTAEELRGLKRVVIVTKSFKICYDLLFQCVRQSARIVKKVFVTLVLLLFMLPLAAEGRAQEQSTAVHMKMRCQVIVISH